MQTSDVFDEGLSLSELLHFIVGQSTLPPFGLSISVEYHPKSPTFAYLGAQVCFQKVILPVIHDNREDFFSACIASLAFGGHSYGNP